MDEKFSFLSRKINKQKLKNRTVCKETIKPEKSHCIFSENVVQSWCKKSCFKTRRIGGNQYEKETCSCPGGLYDADHVPGLLRFQQSALRRKLRRRPASSGGDTNVGIVTGGKDGGTSLIFTTGGDQGTYYGFGGVLAGKVSEATSTTVTAITSGGSQANVEAMEEGDAQLGFVQTDVGAYAYNGTRLFEETGKVEDFSTVANLYMEQVQIVTLDETSSPWPTWPVRMSPSALPVPACITTPWTC